MKNGHIKEMRQINKMYVHFTLFVILISLQLSGFYCDNGWIFVSQIFEPWSTEIFSLHQSVYIFSLQLFWSMMTDGQQISLCKELDVVNSLVHDFEQNTNWSIIELWIMKEGLQKFHMGISIICTQKVSSHIWIATLLQNMTDLSPNTQKLMLNRNGHPITRHRKGGGRRC